MATVAMLLRWFILWQFAPVDGAYTQFQQKSVSREHSYFETGAILDFRRLLHLQKRHPRVFISHNYGDKGFTDPGFRGNYAVKDNPNFLMFDKPIAMPSVFPVVANSAATLKQAQADVGHITDSGSWQALSTLLSRGWFRQAREWQLSELVTGRLLRNDRGWLVQEPEQATLVLINGNTTGARHYLQWERDQAFVPRTQRHFGVVPYARSLTQALLSEYRLDDDNRALLRYGRLHDGDINLPMLSPIMPHGYQRLSDLDELYNKPRRWLLSFVGSAYRPTEPKAALSIERYQVVKKLVELEIAYAQQGSASFVSAQLKQCISMMPQKQQSSLFAAPMTTFPEASGLNTVSDRVVAALSRLERAAYNGQGGSFGNRTFGSTELQLAVHALHASSLYSLQLAGDGPYRSSQVSSMLMGAIPVIMDWQANALASWFNAILFQTQDRFEDIFIVLDWKAAHEHPEYIIHRLCDDVVSGELMKRQKRLRRIVDFLSYRLDGEHEDGFSMAMRLLQDQQETLQKEGQLRPGYSKVWEWPHFSPLSKNITKTRRHWAVHKSYRQLQSEYAREKL
eukprot:m.242783 g.242783  ORF g.242783 m.242783 type:complete len:567 (+) comp17455_c1_seq73:2514-4214(+)